jgi:hypothetical protein
MSKAMNAHDEVFELVEVFGTQALYTDNRIDRSTIPEKLYCYDIRHGDSGDPASLEHKVTVNHMGTVICPEPLLEESAEYRAISDEDINYLCEDATLDDIGYTKPEHGQTPTIRMQGL